MHRIGRSLIVRLLRWVTLSSFGASAISAQSTPGRLVQDVVACARCELRRETRVVFTSSSIEGEITDLPFGVRVDPVGNLWVLAENTSPRAYSPTGSFTRTFGRSGRGPGEFVAVEDMFWVPGDSLITVDGGNRRVTVFAPDGRHVRDIRTPAQLAHAIVLRWPSEVLVSGHVPATSTVGLYLHFASFTDADLTLTRSFGPDRGLLRPGYRGTNWHLTARGRDSSFVTAKPEQFRVYTWDRQGSLRATLIRNSTWFPDSGAGRIGTPDRPPTPAITAIDVDSDGLIWLFVRVAAPTWRRAWARVPPGAREAFRRQIDFPSLYNTRVEVINPLSHRLLATTEIPGLAVSALGNGRVAVYGAGPDGEAALRIDQLRLLPPKRQ